MMSAIAFLVLLMLTDRRGEAAPATVPPFLPPPTSAPLPPVSALPPIAATTPVAWPQTTPADLPPFPGGWEPDEPPPSPVVARAYQLLNQLWAQGAGSRKTEQTAGRWITYRAEVVASGKKGVVAYRVKSGAHPAAAPAAPVATAPHPGASAPVYASTYTPASAPHAPSTAHPGPAPGVPPFVPPVGPPPTAPAVWIPGSSPTAPGKRLLKRGMKGDDVAWVQTHLGVPTTPTSRGTFGPATEAAVRKFQTPYPEIGTNGHPDGQVGPKTWAKMFTAFGAPMA